MYISFIANSLYLSCGCQRFSFWLKVNILSRKTSACAMIEILECQVSYQKGHDSLWVRVTDKKRRSVCADSVCSDFYSTRSPRCVSGGFSVRVWSRGWAVEHLLDNVMLKWNASFLVLFNSFLWIFCISLHHGKSAIKQKTKQKVQRLCVCFFSLPTWVDS